MPRKKKKSRRQPVRKTPTPAEQVFIDEYLIDYNGTRAYREAFPQSTYHTARTTSSSLLAKPYIAREIAAARKARQARTRVRADKVIRELARIAFSDIFDLFDADGRLRAARDIPIETRKALASVKVRKEKTTTRGSGETTITEKECEVEYKFWSKLDALGKLCNHLGLTTEIAPLDALLSALPHELAAAVRAELAGTVPATNHSPDAGGAEDD